MTAQQAENKELSMFSLVAFSKLVAFRIHFRKLSQRSFILCCVLLCCMQRSCVEFHDQGQCMGPHSRRCDLPKWQKLCEFIMSTQSDVCGLIRIVCTHLHHHRHLLEYDELLNRLKCHNNQNGTLIVNLCVCLCAGQANESNIYDHELRSRARATRACPLIKGNFDLK